MKSEYILTIDKGILEKYNTYYFSKHPRAKKKPIENPYHPSINTWFILKRMSLNNLKQKWKDFILWLTLPLVKRGLSFDKFELYIHIYMPTKRPFDLDNCTPKFILDGLVESGFISDDNINHLVKLSLTGAYDKNNPRTELHFKKIE